MFLVYITTLVLIVKQIDCNIITITPQEENDFFESWSNNSANDGIAYINSVGGQTFCEQFKTRAHYTKDHVQYLRMEDCVIAPQNQHAKWENIKVKGVICELSFDEHIGQQKSTLKYEWIISPISKNRYCKLFATDEKWTTFHIQQCYKMSTGVWGKIVGLANKIA